MSVGSKTTIQKIQARENVDQTTTMQRELTIPTEVLGERTAAEAMFVLVQYIVRLAPSIFFEVRLQMCRLAMVAASHITTPIEPHRSLIGFV